jgi:hypothetical protein
MSLKPINLTPSLEENSETLSQSSQTVQLPKDKPKIVGSLVNTSKKSKWPKKKLSAIAEFTILTWLGWLDPTLGFWISVMVLVWHLITDRE